MTRARAAWMSEAVPKYTRGRCVQAQRGVAMFVAQVVEEARAPGAGMLDRVEPFGKIVAVLQRFELRLTERVVVRHPWARVAAGDAEVDQQLSDGL